MKSVRFTFTLRRAFIAIALLGVVFSGVRWWYMRIYTQIWAVSELQALGGISEYSRDYRPSTEGGPGWFGPSPPLSHWRHAVVGVKIRVPFRSDEDAEKVNRLLRHLPYLVDVQAINSDYSYSDPRRARIADNHLASAIKGLPIAGVTFDTRIEGVETATVCRDNNSLSFVQFGQSPPQEGQLPLLCANPTLRRLRLLNGKVAGKDVETASRAVQLEELHLTSPPVEDLMQLAKLPQCSVFINSSRYTDNDLQDVLSQLPNLRTLRLSFNENITDEGVASLRTAKSLVYLSLQDAPNVTDAGVLPLRELPQLESINLTNTQVTTKGVLELCRGRAFKSITVSEQLRPFDLRKELPDTMVYGSSSPPRPKAKPIPTQPATAGDASDS